MINQHFPQIRMGACIDDRNFKGNLHDIVQTHDLISTYDRLAGHLMQPNKTAIAATATEVCVAIKKLTLDGHPPKLVSHEVLVGDLVTTASRDSKSHTNTKTDRAYAMDVRLSSPPVPRPKKVEACCTAIVPKAICSTQWDMRCFSKSGRLRTAITGNTFGAGSKMVCVEILMLRFFDPTRSDPTPAAFYRTFTHARGMTRKSVDRYTEFIRTWQHPDNLTSKAQGPADRICNTADILQLKTEIV